MKQILLAFLSVLLVTPSVAKTKKMKVDMSAALTARQKRALSSGFSTFIQLTVSLEGAGRVIDKEFSKKTCTVKYDSWEERYQINVLGVDHSSSFLGSFKKFSKKCLSIYLPKSKEASLRQADTLVATLQVEQISAEQAGKVRDWIIKQQSGVMQGLFSHMLGELTVSDSVEVRIPLNELKGPDDE